MPRRLQRRALCADNPRRPQPVLRVPTRCGEAAPAHLRRRDLERGELADVLASGERSGDVRRAARPLLRRPPRTARTDQRDQLHCLAARPGGICLRPGRELPAERAKSPALRHVRPQPVSRELRRSALGASSRLRRPGGGRLRNADERAADLVHGDGPAAPGPAGRRHLVRGGRVSDRRPAGETTLLSGAGERPACRPRGRVGCGRRSRRRGTRRRSCETRSCSPTASPQ